MNTITPRQDKNREELQKQFYDDICMFVSGWEWEAELVEDMTTEQCLSLQNTLERVMLYKQAGWIG